MLHFLYPMLIESRPTNAQNLNAKECDGISIRLTVFVGVNATDTAF